MAVKDTWQKITDRQTAMAELNARQDKTAEYLRWDDNPYILTKPDGKTQLKDAISVTPNKPKVFAHGIIANLLNGKWQTVVEGKLSDKQAAVVEQFIEDNFLQADEFLQSRFRIPSLFNWLCNHVAVRWAIGVQWLTLMKKGEYTIHCVPVDMRWCPFEDGPSGLADGWIAPITWRGKESLRKEYPNLSLPTSDGSVEVRDYWDAKVNELWVDRKKVFEQKNPFGYPPFVVVIPATGFMLRDKGYLKYEGEDVLFLNRGMLDEYARTLSLQQTAGYSALYPAYERERAQLDGKPSQPVPKIDESLDVMKGERHQPVPRGDVSRAGMMARDDILKMIEEGGVLAPKSYNTPPSAVELYGEAELIGQIQNARKDALGALRSSLARMSIEQTIKISKGGGSLEIGGIGRKNTYNVTQLGDPDKYYISYRLMIKSKRQEIANLAQFATAYDRLPLKYNLANILMAEDPDGIIKEMEMEKARKADPAIALSEMAIRYAEEAEETEDETEKEMKNWQSMLLVERAVSVIRGRMMPPAEPPQGAEMPQVEKPPGASSDLLSLVGRQEGGATGGLLREQK